MNCRSAHLVPDSIPTPIGDVPRVSNAWKLQDYLGWIRVRINIRRDNYKVSPGLYAIGSPTPDAPVFVSANYKLSFDRLRQQLDGIDGWIMVLDTKGINVWCAAGKGTFGTEEIVRQVESVQLDRIVDHRELIIPQLGAPGVAAHKVKKQSGFKVVYGPIRAEDIPAFLASEKQCTPDMRKVQFRMLDRLAVIPVEITLWFKSAVILALIMILLGGFESSAFLFSNVWKNAPDILGKISAAFICGILLVPLLLPWIPARALSIQGAMIGLLLSASFGLGGGFASSLAGWGWLLVITSISSFMALQYTGTTTYTGHTGVKKEMKTALPAQFVALLIGLGIWIAARFV